MNGVVGKSSVENPVRIFVKKIFGCCLVLTGREPGGSRGSGGFLVSSWTTSGPQSSQSPSSSRGPRPARSPRLRDTRLGSRPPRQRRESPGLDRVWWGRTEEILTRSYPSGRWCSWTRTWPSGWGRYSVCTNPFLDEDWWLAGYKLKTDCQNGQTIPAPDIWYLPPWLPDIN